MRTPSVIHCLTCTGRTTGGSTPDVLLVHVTGLRFPRRSGGLRAAMIVAFTVTAASGQNHGAPGDDDDDVPAPAVMPATSWGPTRWTAPGVSTWTSGRALPGQGSDALHLQPAPSFGMPRYGAEFPSFHNPAAPADEPLLATDSPLPPSLSPLAAGVHPKSAQPSATFLNFPSIGPPRIDPLRGRVLQGSALFPRPRTGAAMKGPSSGTILTTPSQLLRDLAPRTLTDDCLAKLLDPRSPGPLLRDARGNVAASSLVPRFAPSAGTPTSRAPALPNQPSLGRPLSFEVPALAPLDRIGVEQSMANVLIRGAGSQPAPALRPIDLEQLLSGKPAASPSQKPPEHRGPPID